MPIVQVEAELTAEELLKAVTQLGPAELERFVSEVILLQAHRRAPSLPRRESELLQAINEGLPAEVRARYDALIAKRDEETLTPDEYSELLRLSDQIEELHAQRMEALGELARLRQTSLPDLMDRLGIPRRTHA